MKQWLWIVGTLLVLSLAFIGLKNLPAPRETSALSPHFNRTEHEDRESSRNDSGDLGPVHKGRCDEASGQIRRCEDE